MAKVGKIKSIVIEKPAIKETVAAMFNGTPYVLVPDDTKSIMIVRNGQFYKLEIPKRKRKIC